MPRSIQPNQGRGPVPVSAGTGPASAAAMAAANPAAAAANPAAAGAGGVSPEILQALQSAGGPMIQQPTQGIQQALQALLSRSGGGSASTAPNVRQQMPTGRASVGAPAANPTQTAQNLASPLT